MEQSDRFGAAMKIEVLDTEEAVAERAASIIAEAAGEAAATRGRFAFAVSGGRTPWVMLAALARKDVPWPTVHLFQVDERVAPTGDPEEVATFPQRDSSLVSLKKPTGIFMAREVRDARKTWAVAWTARGSGRKMFKRHNDKARER
jgi:hypothetical protein